MELKKYLNEYEIIGVVSSYKINDFNGEYVKDLNVKNIEKALKMVDLDSSFLDKKISSLTLSELFKIDLITKLNGDIIIVGNLSKMLIYKDIEYIKKLLLKLNADYHKKIVIIDEDVSVFMNIVKYIYVMKNKEIVYSTDSFYDSKLYEFVRVPKIVEFVKYVKESHEIDEHIDIYELIKDIYRRVS